MESLTAINLEDTETGFASKTDRDLQQAKFLYSIMNVNWIVWAGTLFLPLALKWRLPIRRLINDTIFRQFVGGKSLPDTKPVLSKLSEFKVRAILDYGAEGKDNENSFNTVCNEFITLINYASESKDVSFISIKVTGLGRFSLLEKINSGVEVDKSGLIINTDHLSDAEVEEWNKVVGRIDSVCHNGEERNVGVLVDAEDSWIQDTIDAIIEMMMKKYNRRKAIVFNTIQFYRVGRLNFLKSISTNSVKEGYFLGVKIVRGAYMEKERLRASQLHYPSPIQPDKISTDHDFNYGLEYCIQNLDTISVIIACHNDQSVLLAVELLKKHNFPKDHPNIHFSQLYGMGDNITFNLAKAGYRVSKYLPYGPLEDVVPYLMRRAQENTSVSSQTGKELGFINREVRRRRLASSGMHYQ